MFDKLAFGTEETKHVIVWVFLLRGITCVTFLSTALTRIRKEMDTLLYKVSVIDTLLGTKLDIL
jgi:hypothetical protein